ncbi:MAG: hypothetical protein PHO32_06665 [Candidatus Cloacimonetes bacterium]|nr:hypothetical protein [Candidatus Cloacimonadota bacterium]
MINMINVISILLKKGRPKDNAEYHWEKEKPPTGEEENTCGSKNLFSDSSESGLLPW